MIDCHTDMLLVLVALRRHPGFHEVSSKESIGRGPNSSHAWKQILVAQIGWTEHMDVSPGVFDLDLGPEL